VQVIARFSRASCIVASVMPGDKLQSRERLVSSSVELVTTGHAS
jgi:hypothetical protein